MEALQRKTFVRKNHSRAPAPKKDWLQGSAGSKQAIASNEGGIWRGKKFDDDESDLCLLLVPMKQGT